MCRSIPSHKNNHTAIGTQFNFFNAVVLIKHKNDISVFMRQGMPDQYITNSGTVQRGKSRLK